MIVDARQGEVTKLGRLGENEARTVRFLIRDVISEHPEAEITLLNRRPGDANAYPVPSANVRREGFYLLWTVTSGDLTKKGDGECELVATEDGAICKSVYYDTEVLDALDGSGTVPDPWTGWVTQVTDAADRAEAAAALLENPGAEAVTLAPGSQATASYADGVFLFGIPRGANGDPGQPGQDGAPGRDGADGKDGAPGRDGADGKDGADGNDGAPGKDGADGAPGKDGKDGKDGADGHTPVKGTDYWTAEDQAEIVAAAAAAAAGEVIDDTAGDGVTNRTWSADKLSDLNNQITAKQDAPASGAAAGKVLGLTEVSNELVPTWVNQPSVPVTDVQVNGVSVLSQGVANVPVASDSAFGAVKVGTGLKIVATDNTLRPNTATATQAKAGTESYYPITPLVQDASTFYGLAKAAGDSTQSASSNSVGTYTDAAKKAIREMLGIYDWELLNTITVSADSENIEINMDQNGGPFECKKILARIALCPSTTGSTSAIYTNIGVKFKDGTTGSVSSLSALSAQASNRFADYIVELIGSDTMIGMNRQGSVPGNTQNYQGSSAKLSGQVKSINYFKLYQSSASSTLIPKDTTIELYGIRV